jgi:lipopolysaccharide transport protein LptA/LPS export ABC transporter protein LptC
MPLRGSLTVGRIKALRWIALGVAAVLAVGLGVLWRLGRTAKVEMTRSDTESTQGATEVGKGFDHTITHEGKPLLRIRGQRDRYDKEGNLHVEEVLITAYQEDGSRYEVAADVATYNLQEKQAILEGHVSLAGPEGFALRTKKLVLKQGGRWLVSDSQVNFQYGTDPPMAGRAQELHAQVNRGEFVLSGGVGIRSMGAAAVQGEQEPFSMSAQVVVFERTLHQLRADGKVQLKYGGSHMDADRLAVHLSPTDNRLQFVRARWGVRAEFHDVDEQNRPSFLVAEGDSLAVLFDDAGKVPTRFELEGDGKQQVHMRRGADNGEAFDLVASQADAHLVGGRLTTAEASGGVTVVNEGGGTPRRQLSSRNAHAEFSSGTLAQLEVRGNVHASEPGRGDLTADRAVVTGGQTDAWGSPVRLESPKGQLRAPHVTYTREGALAHAVDGVEALIPPGKDNPMSETPIASGNEPVQVQAQEAFWRDEPRSFLFKGKVRAWSGDRVLRAEQLRGDAAQQQLTAAGSVQTVWFMPAPKAEAPAAAATPAVAPTPTAPAQGSGPKQAGAQRQVRVESDTLVFSDAEHQLTYDGNVRVVDGERTMHSKTLVVDLTAKGQAKRMTATGEVKLEAPAEGRTITAERAVYDVETRRIVFRGSPVTLQDKKGGNLTGKQAVYSMETGKVRVTANEEEGPGT